MKTCSKCGDSKPCDQFSKNKHAKDGRQRWCKDCVRASYNPERRRTYYEANRQHSLDTGRAYRKANREQHNERQRAYRRANRERLVERDRTYYEANRERYAENGRAWRNANADKRRGYFARRRARKACAVPQRWQVHDVLPFCCYWCGSNLRAYGVTSHVDHVMPISLGGPADPSNEVATCASCNFRKNAKHPLVWIAELVA